MFLETLMFHFQNQKQLSLSDLCNDLAINCKVRLKKQSLDERFNSKALLFMKNLMEKAIVKFVRNDTAFNFFNSFSSVKIKDSTSFDLPESMKSLYPGNGGGASNSGMNMQFEYDLKTNDIIDLSIYSKKENDYKNAHQTLSDVRENDLIIRDLGYIGLELLEKITKLKAFFLNRIKPQTTIYEKVKGKYIRVSLKSISKKLRKTGMPYLEKKVYIGERKYLPCRMVFILIPDDKKKEREKRQMRKAKRRGSNKIDNRVLEAIDLNIFITNTSQKQIPPSEVYNVYKLRWQIELIFKTWKQISQINLLKQAKAHRIMVIIYAQLLWIIINWKIISLFMVHYFKLKRNLLSIYKTYKTLNLLKPQLKRSIRNKNQLCNIIENVGIIFSNNHFKEKRKGGYLSTEIIATFIS